MSQRKNICLELVPFLTTAIPSHQMTRVCRRALKTPRALVVSRRLCLGSVEHSVPVEWAVDERARAICSHATGSFIASTRHKWQVSTRWIPEIITNHEDQPEPKRRPYLPLHQRSVHRYPFSYLSGRERYCCRGRRAITCTTGIHARGLDGYVNPLRPR